MQVKSVKSPIIIGLVHIPVKSFILAWYELGQVMKRSHYFTSCSLSATFNLEAISITFSNDLLRESHLGVYSGSIAADRFLRFKKAINSCRSKAALSTFLMN
jgi:hypothetical protein